MPQFKVGIAFSREYLGNFPLSHIGSKLPVYIRLLELCLNEDWQVYVLTKKTYKGGGVFEGSWKFSGGKFEKIKTPVKIDLVYDRSGGVKFPPDGDESAIWVNKREFKVLCWDKRKAYLEIGEYMPKTFWVEKERNLPGILLKIKTDWVVLKPYNGLKGLGVFIGPKDEAKTFKFAKRFKHYIAQEFVDTSGGISPITTGLHDLRVAIVNGVAVWSHVRVPQPGSYLANAAAGGKLTEVDYSLVPSSIKSIVKKVAERFYKNYNNPVYSIDFGVGIDGIPKIFEINDQIGFPKWEMRNRENFLKELILNFEKKLKTS